MRICDRCGAKEGQVSDLVKGDGHIMRLDVYAHDSTIDFSAKPVFTFCIGELCQRCSDIMSGLIRGLCAQFKPELH